MRTTIHPFWLFVLLTSAGLLNFSSPSRAAGVRPSVWVYPDYTGNLAYAADTNGVRINDFSTCGYRQGEVALPDMRNFVPEAQWIQLAPLSNGRDNSALINGALQAVGVRPVNSNGFRGVVYLEAGEYRIDSTIWMTNSGVVLKGAGSSLSVGVRLRPTWKSMDDAISVTGLAPTEEEFSQPESAFNEVLVPAGTRTFRVDHPEYFTNGDNVLIRHRAAENWIRDLDMDKLNGSWFDPEAVTGEYERQITQINGPWITVDAPIPQTFEARYWPGTIRRFAPAGRVQNCGVEDLACIYHLDPDDDDKAHPSAAVLVSDAVNIWIRNVITWGYFSSCVKTGSRTKFVTVGDCMMSTPPGADFHDRYPFLLGHHSANVLMRDCYSEYGRHDYILESAVPGPNAFVRCTTFSSRDDTGPHQRWATGALFDQVSVDDGALNKTSGQLNVQNRGNSGGGNSYHGWAGAYMTVWNCYAESGFRVRNPPTARNWLIGSEGETHGSVRGCWYSFIPLAGDGDCWAVGADPAGTYDQYGENAARVQFRSLYYAQLQQRLKWPGSQFREYRLGDIDQLTNPDAAPVPVDPAWVQQWDAFLTNRFDDARPFQSIVFTFDFPLDPCEQVVAASLTLSLKLAPGVPSPSADERLFLETIDRYDTFGDLGWHVTPSATSVHTIPVSPAELQDGRLNVGVDRNAGVDFAVLHLQVAPALATTTRIATPIDTFVRSGSFANQNFAADPELIVKHHDSGNFARRSFLHWNLLEDLGPLADAKVRLYCKFIGQPGNEQSASLVNARNWSPNSVTWNTQPALSPAMAYWVPEGPGYWSEFTVTPEVRAAFAGDGQLMICLQSVQDFGGAGDVAYASREDPNPALRPQLVLRYTNNAPTIIGPTNRSMNANSTLGPLAVTIGDRETSAGSLVLTAASSNPAVIDSSNIILGGSGSNRTVTIQAPAGRVGTVSIMLTVNDGVQTRSVSFLLNVNYVNSAPVISFLGNRSTPEDTPLSVAFTVSDANNSPGNLVVTASTSNNQLFPAGGIQLLPHDASGNRTLLFTPAHDRSGTVTARVLVSDGFLVTTQAFTLNVLPAEDPPRGVRITRPTAGATFPTNSPILITAEAWDVETNLASILFFRHHPAERSPTIIGSDSNAPYSSTITNSGPRGSEIWLFAAAFDQTGLATTSGPVIIKASTPVTVAPKLFVASVSNSVAVLWSASLSSNALQTTTNFTPPSVWSSMPFPAQDVEGAWLHLLPPTNRQRFFRLAP